jgi:hypothetical protein
MASTDIDGTPILILSALEAEHIAWMLRYSDAKIDWSGGIKPCDTPVFCKLIKFLGAQDVVCYLDEYHGLPAVLDTNGKRVG